MSVRRWSGFVLSLTIVVLASSSTASPQNVLTGTCTALDNKHPDKIDLRFDYRMKLGGHSSPAEPYQSSELLEVTREQAQGSGLATFSVVREAGRIDCFFKNGKGSGTFRFTADVGFLSAMKSRGFDFASRTDSEADGVYWLFIAATLNVTTALADDLNSAGFGKLNIDDLFKAAIFKVDSSFKREMSAAGFGDLGMEELIKARIFNINAELISEAKQMGFESESLEGLVKLRIFKVTPELIAEARNEGLTNLSLEDAVRLRIFNIDSEFIRKARADGVPVDMERLVERRIGVGQKP